MVTTIDHQSRCVQQEHHRFSISKMSHIIIIIVVIIIDIIIAIIIAIIIVIISHSLNHNRGPGHDFSNNNSTPGCLAPSNRFKSLLATPTPSNLLTHWQWGHFSLVSTQSYKHSQ
ncbi:hypothetical protein V8F33_009189 [Rhypophila sp. PSN 637]